MRCVPKRGYGERTRAAEEGDAPDIQFERLALLIRHRRPATGAMDNPEWEPRERQRRTRDVASLLNGLHSRTFQKNVAPLIGHLSNENFLVSLGILLRKQKRSP
jgi:hypothetical protein